MNGCVFCEIVTGLAPATIFATWRDATAFIPLNPVVDGHVLVVPHHHVRDFAEAPETTAAVMKRAAELAHHLAGDYNLITSKGESASQTVFHLHVHLVPRREGDGLALPWTGQSRDGGESHG